MTIAYALGNALYLNITNECPCNCSFCIRNNAEGINPGESLWLEREPTLDEIIASINEADLTKYQEIVFCGYGEPTCRLDVLLKCAKSIKRLHPMSIRLNTNGLCDLINGKKTVPLLAECIDCISISLNAPDAKSYQALCEPIFGEHAYGAMIQFAKDCKAHISDTALSVVGHALDHNALEACRSLCNSLDIPLRVR